MSDFRKHLNREELDVLLNDVLDVTEVNIDFANKILNRNIILYGAGSLGVMGINLLKEVNIIPKFIIDKNESLWGKKIENIRVISPNSVSENDKKECLFAICIVKFPFSEIENFLKSIGCKNVLSFWDVVEYYKDTIKMTNGWVLRNLTLDDKRKIRYVYNNLEDIESKAGYVQVLYWRIRREEILFKNLDIDFNDIFFPNDIPYELSNNECYLDCGAYKGNIIEKFLKNVNGQFNKIIAFEPDPNNYESLCTYINKLQSDIRRKIETYSYGLGAQNGVGTFLSNRDMSCRFIDEQEAYNVKRIKVKLVKIDSVLKETKVTIIKIHAEGMEYEVLRGGIELIINKRPIIILTTYHSKEGIMDIPLFLMETLKEYKFYHRLHSYCGNDSVLYAVPKERIKDN